MSGEFDDVAPRRARGSRAATAVALGALVVVPLLAGALTTGTPAALLGLPVESIAVVLVLLAAPGRLVGVLAAAAFAAVVVGAALLGALDSGFEATIDRAFDPAQDGPALVSAFGVVGDAVGTGNAIVIVGLVAASVVTAMIFVARAALRAGRAGRRSGEPARVVATAVAAAWIIAAVTGAQLWPGVPLAAADAATALASTSAQTAQSLREEAAFERALRADADPVATGDRTLAGLEGKDVVIAFVESYGAVAVDGADFTAGIDDALEAGDAQLSRDGYAARSAFLTSPTFGGVSWLAHATLQSGTWVDSQQKYDRLLGSDRTTLTRVFQDAGWRTVSVVPSNIEPWPAGQEFYGYDVMLDARNMGYRGPAFSYARIPDQYTWQLLHDRALDAQHPEPVMAEVDFVSSHTPWTPIPQLVAWSRIGDGSVFDGQPARGPAPVDVWPDEQRVRAAYADSVRYSLEAMFSYLETYDQPDLVLIVLGDHQPARIVSGADAGHGVPVTIIAKDPGVFARIASWGWDEGVRPSAGAPTWRMDEFRDRFLQAFER